MKNILIKFFVGAFCGGVCLTSHAQMLNSNLILIKPSAYISEWSNPTTGRFIVINSNNQTASPVKIYFELKDEANQIIIQSNLNTQNDFLLTTGVNNFSIGQFFLIDNAKINSETQKMLVNTARLKAGMYQLSVQLFKDSAGFYIPASSMQSKMFTINSYQLPILTAPYNEQLLESGVSKSFITFRWTPLVPSATFLVKYVLKITEVLDDQTPYQALQSNPVLFEKEISKVTQYIWQPLINITDSTSKKFIWTIQTIDSQGNPIESMNSNTSALAAPSVFYIKPTLNVQKKQD